MKNKYSYGGGQNTYKINPLFKDIKEYNKYLLSLIGIFVLLLTGIISYNYTNTSYAKWSSSIESKNVLKLSVKSNNKPNAPELTSNMIPVYYDSTNKVWRKADSTNKDNSWYDYDNKMWANAVTISEKGNIESVKENESVELITLDSRTYTDETSDEIFTFTVDSNTSYRYCISNAKVSFNGSRYVYNDMYCTTRVSSSDLLSSNYYYVMDIDVQYFYELKSLKSSSGSTYVYNTIKHTIKVNGKQTKKYIASSYQFTNGKFKLVSPTLETYSSSSVGKYTCDSETLSECTMMYKVKTAEENKVTKVDKYQVGSGYANSSNKYDNASVGTEISMDDISTMWVWIPRYKYIMLNTCANIKNPTEEANPSCYEYVYKDEYHDDLINELVNLGYASDETEAEEMITSWKNREADDNYGITFNEYANPDNSATELTFDKSFVSTNVGEQSFDIKFESNKNSSGTIKCIDAVTGTSSTSETCTDTTNNGLKAGTSTYTHPAFTFGDKELTGIWVGKFEISSGQIIKPNVTSLRSQTVNQLYTGIYNMRNSGNAFGFSTTDETHMIKNMEWGAVAYLSHSKYGINKEIAKNGASTYTTGCGPQSAGSTSEGSTCNAYNTALGQSASTTGNVYGIYDMSGGSWEYVMGNMLNSSGAFYSSSAGFSTTPEAKYYDKYSYGTSQTGYTRGKLGDATVEMSSVSLGSCSWYSDYATLPYSFSPWLIRGGGGTGVGVGAFSFDSGSGAASNSNSSRAVLGVIK